MRGHENRSVAIQPEDETSIMQMPTALKYRLRDSGRAVLVLALAACGGEAKYRADSAEVSAKAESATQASSATTGPASAAGASAKAATGKTWDVAMYGDAKGYRFEPSALSIKAGDAVRWTIVSGPPHNVTFWPDSIPSGATAQLGANMPEATAPLTGPLRMNPRDTYIVSFAGVSVGTYRYYCTPHLALGMRAILTVQ